MRCPDDLLASLRAWIDVDVVWCVDRQCWIILEQCAKPSRWATVNGRRLEGWRQAAEYRDMETNQPYWLNELIGPWLRARDIENFDGNEASMYLAQFDLQEELREASIEAGWDKAEEKAYDRAHTMQKGLSTGKRGPRFGGFRKG